MTNATIPAGLQAQRDFVEQLESQNFGWDLMIGDAFVRGMRDIGYKSTAFAIAELADNSIQAGANQLDIVFGYDQSKMPARLAIIDNGHGMEPTMVRASLVWGAGTRADNRDGMGKYGYGLPSASVSQCYRVEVYSKTAGTPWCRAYLDIDEIKDGKWTTGNRIEMPREELHEPPAFVVDYLKKEKRWDGFTQGTVVVWDRLDKNRIDSKQAKPLRDKLVTNLGVIYRRYLGTTAMKVDGVKVEPCDPLFLTEGFRYYSLDSDRATALDPSVVDVKDKETGAVVGQLRVRYSMLPATFFRKPEFKHTNKPGRNAMNERLDIADANNGIVFLRNGRQIDVVRPPRNRASFNATTDRFWGVEVDFDATLDDKFSITTSKQQVTPDDSIWDMLDQKANVFKAIGEMRNRYKKSAKEIANAAEQRKDGTRASIEALEGAEKFRTTPPPADTAERATEAKENLDREAQKRATKAGIQPEAVERELVAERSGASRRIEQEDMPGAPFYRCVQEGGTRVLYVNTAHAFFSELYQGPGSTPRLRAGLEILLWILGDAEVDAEPHSDARQFYIRQRANVWSPGLADALQQLMNISVVETEAEAEEEEAAA